MIQIIRFTHFGKRYQKLALGVIATNKQNIIFYFLSSVPYIEISYIENFVKYVCICIDFLFKVNIKTEIEEA